MPEQKYPVVVASIYPQFITQTPTTYSFDSTIAKSIKFDSRLKRKSEAILVQAAGVNLVYDIVDAMIQEPGTMEIEWVFRDPSNTTDATCYEVNRWLYENGASITSNTALAAEAGITGATTGGSRIFYTLKLVFANAGGPGSAKYISVPVCVVELGQITPKGEYMAYTVKYEFAGTPTRG